jgi:ribosomal protein L11 methyltransferase
MRDDPSKVYSLHLISSSDDADRVCAELWEAGTEGIQEIETGQDTTVRLIASFRTNEAREHLLTTFAVYSPEWHRLEETDWVARTEAAWPAREVGNKIFLAAPWNRDPTPQGRVRVVHNPGLACGTGEHACTRLALMALEECVRPGSRVVDIGTGSGILAVAALRLGAGFALGIDPDVVALAAAQENFRLNGLAPTLASGSADCVSAASADVIVSNINASVLLSMLDDLLLITAANGWLILTGFTEDEFSAVQQNVPEGSVLAMDEWRCLTVRLS